MCTKVCSGGCNCDFAGIDKLKTAFYSTPAPKADAPPKLPTPTEAVNKGAFIYIYVQEKNITWHSYFSHFATFFVLCYFYSHTSILFAMIIKC